MKKFILMLIVPFISIIAKETKIGFVESDRIFEEYQATNAADIEFNNFVDMCRDSAAVLRNNIEISESEFETQKLMLSEEARLRKLDEIDSQTKIYNQFLQNVFGSGGKIDQKNDELMGPLLKRMNEAISKIAEEKNFNVILDLSEDVFYASSELDITNLVIDELNLEYGPSILPTGETKKRIAIFPFREKNSEAVIAELYQRCQNELYTAIRAFTQQFEVIGKTEINSEIFRRGLGRNVDDSQAIKIGLSKLCDYIIIGDVSKFSTKIEYTISLKDVNDNVEVMKRSNTVTEDIKLFETLKNDLIALLDKIKQE